MGRLWRTVVTLWRVLYRYVEGWRKTSAAPPTHMRHYQPRHMDVYNNSGYMSDEERNIRSRRESRESKESRDSKDSSSRGYRAPSGVHSGVHRQDGASHGPHRVHGANSSQQRHFPSQFTPGGPSSFRYVGEMKFP